MEQRQHRDDDVIGLHVEKAAGDVGVHVQLHVSQFGALRAPGRARGVDDDGGVGQRPRREHVPLRGNGEQPLERLRARGTLGVADRVDLGQPGSFGALAGVAEHALPGDEDLRPAVAQVECHLRRLEQRVQRHHHGAGLQDPEVGDQELRDVRQLQGYRVSRLDASRLQLASKPVRQLVQLTVGQLAAIVDNDRLIR